MMDMVRLLSRWALLVCGVAITCAAGAAFQVPPLTGPVVDRGQILSSSAEKSLDAAIRHLRQSGGSQLQILTVPSLEGMTIEQAAIQVVETWKLGDAKDDRGVLLMISRDDRRMRIEVGQGNEGALTDVQSKRIIADSITPLFRAGDYDSGVLVGVYQIARTTDPEIDIAPYLEGAARTGAAARPRVPLNGWIIVLILIWFVLTKLLRGGGRGGRGLRSRRGIYYGYGGGWSGGGGGWRGGGGGFSGGGASGGW